MELSHTVGVRLWAFEGVLSLTCHSNNKRSTGHLQKAPGCHDPPQTDRMGDCREVKTPERLEQLLKCMEVLLSEVEQLRGYCGHSMTELTRVLLELREERREMTERYEVLSQDVQSAVEALGELQETKFTFDSKMRQTQKLNRQL
ncbi:hypothetical protein DPEC_G00320160 [Dallia pectoralis]|uniref:Uncharacterized protein n=1 Tax=Dallia pectoralis TaxID=75939 RepID=A0ACC2F9T2_DALPE|nr:hypothetical protein DPEC_G00320160 [Dallia pectoralis]